MTQTQTELSYNRSLFICWVKSPIPWIFIFSLAYWTYLLLTTQMEIKFDSIDYLSLGQMLGTRDWFYFFRTGPHREPVYLLIIAASIKLANLVPLPQQTILKIFQVLILFVTQVMVFFALKKLNIHRNIAAVAILYLGFSPALVNSALSVYSEIATYPIILGIIFCATLIWKMADSESSLSVILPSLFLGLLFLIITLTKGIFEAIVPFFLISFLWRLVSSIEAGAKKKALNILLSLIFILGVYYPAILGYKYLNKKYNGNFVLTDRASWAIYGYTARRVQPMTPQRLLAALAYIPGEGVCQALCDKKECVYWSIMGSDAFAFTKIHELEAQGLSGQRMNDTFLRLSKKEFKKNPVQYFLFFGLEGFKILFWESTKIGWVIYPPALTQLFDYVPFKDGLRFLIFLITTSSLLYFVWFIATNRKEIFGSNKTKAAQNQTAETSHMIYEENSSEKKENDVTMVLLIFYFIIIYTASYSFFSILTRCALPIAPLFLILISFSAQQIYLSMVKPADQEKSLVTPQKEEPRQTYRA